MFRKKKDAVEILKFCSGCFCSLTFRTVNIVGRYSSVGIASRYWLDGPGDRNPVEVRFSAPVHTGPGANPASCTVGTGSFPGVKRPERGVDHPPHLAPRLRTE
jgi:hypothetical protein